MGKHGFLTPKAISNRIKAKGLQKLRWYCQMCQKQCRDENGFKCHLTSESHQRQLLLFADNPDKFIDSFSQEFQETFMELLRRRFGTRRVQANNVYQEYIGDKEHTHMNSTQWETLTDFVKWLGREGHCLVDQTEKGWFITYIDRDPEAIRRQEASNKKERMDLDDDEKMARFIDQQMERASAASTSQNESPVYTELQRDEGDKVVLNTFKQPTAPAKIALGKSALKAEVKDKPGGEGAASRLSKSATKRKSALDDIMALEEGQKEKQHRKDYWLHAGIVVKVVTKKLGEKYHKKKGVVRAVEDDYVAIVKMLESGDKIRLDQAHLETVIPALDKPVLIVNGAYRGSEALLTAVDAERFSCSVTISKGLCRDRQVTAAYEDISKLHVT